MVVVFQSILDKARVLHSFDLTEKTIGGVNPQSLTDVMARYRAERRREKNVIIRYNNMVLAHWHDDAAADLMEEEIPEDDSRYETDRQVLQQQQREYEEAMRQSQLLEERRQQERDHLRKKEEALQSLQEQRKVRKLSLPEEPLIGDIVRLNFRCPNGTKISRNFERGEKLELVYHWVETNEDIEFEDEARQFELLHMHGCPPVPIGGARDKLLRDLFQEEIEQLVIKEL